MSKTIFTACLATETNSFSPIPTGLELFRRTMFVRGGTYGERPGPFALPLIVWRDRSTRCCSNSTADGGGRLSGRRSRAGAPRARTGLTSSFCRVTGVGIDSSAKHPLWPRVSDPFI